MNELNGHIESILVETFKVLDAVYSNQREDILFHPCEESRLIFPRYSLRHKDDTVRDPETRVSEQELRFAFVEQFNRICKSKNWPYYYSVETPTDKRYVVSKGIEPRVAEKDEGVSAQFDLVIHDDEGRRKCRIEFKAGMSSPEKEFAKDFLKLNEESGESASYFVHLLDENANQNTFTRIKNNRLQKKDGVIYICHVIKGKTYSEGSKSWEPLPSK